jgi:two-component system, OmpR family, phosphate regulon response regulator PhoB
MRRTRVLLISNDSDPAGAAAGALVAGGYDVRREHDSIAGLIAVEEWRPDLVVLDWCMPFISGSIFLYALKTNLERPPEVIALVEPGAEAEARGAGVRETIEKPISVMLLERRVGQILDGAVLQ